jgi:hypothetical protein
MEKRAEKAIDQVSSGDKRLATLLRAGRIFDELDRRLQPELAENSRGHIQVACVDGDCLVLAATSPAWASRARLEAPGLLEVARKIWPEDLRRTRVIVAPPVDPGN